MSVGSDNLAYGGDKALGRLLKDAGARLALPGGGVAALRTLIAGVLAAPQGGDACAWLDLVAEDPGAELKGQLQALKAEMAAALVALGRPSADVLSERLGALRKALAREKLDGFLVPHRDQYNGEYVPLCAQRLTWITGFTGTAGFAVILAETAALFVDGRYQLQAKGQIDAANFAIHHSTTSPAEQWIGANLGRGQRLGYDPWLHTMREVEKFREACDKAGAELVPCSANPVDDIWQARAPAPISPIRMLDDRFSGETSAKKRTRLAGQMAADGIDGAVLTLPDSIAWLLNIRGGDMAYTPLVLAFAVLNRDGTVHLFTDERKLTPRVRAAIGNDVSVAGEGDFAAALDRLGAKGRTVLADPVTAPAWVFQRLDGAGAKIRKGADPCVMPKACKNSVELDGIRRAHLRDGVALTRYLAWIAATAPLGGLTEMAAAAKVEEFRRQGEHYRGLSFPTISGSGANGAIVHYQVNQDTNREIKPGDIYLVDSGVQYLDGTTDVTRTVFIGDGAALAPSDEQRENFTRVLKGHITLASTCFPKGTSGSQLDALARLALWRVGLDYDHGTGHGVGAYLNVHEGPQRISKIANSVALELGMVVSNEPGYYKAGAYGIRIENLITVRQSDTTGADGRDMYEFETLTQAPIDTALVEPGLMTGAEIDWLNAYHAQVCERLTPLVDDMTAEWLTAATRPLEKA
ncbi:MAG: aminopeptidase P family protein [Alphaproteobacteria bacterium]